MIFVYLRYDAIDDLGRKNLHSHKPASCGLNAFETHVLRICTRLLYYCLRS